MVFVVEIRARNYGVEYWVDEHERVEESWAF